MSGMFNEQKKGWDVFLLFCLFVVLGNLFVFCFWKKKDGKFVLGMDFLGFLVKCF